MKANGRRKILSVLFFIAALVAIFLTGCSKKDVAEETSKKLVKFPVQFSPTGYNQILVPIAKEEGFYAQEGLDVSFENLTGASNVDYITAAVTGKVRISNSAGSTAPLIYLEEAGSKFLMLGGSMSNNGALLIPKGKEKEWEGFTPEKMKGKRIGVRRANSQDTAFRAFLVRNGVDLSTIEVVELDNHPTSIEGVVKGELDGAVVVGIYRTVGQERGLTLYKNIDDLFGHFVCCRAIAFPDHVEANREQYVGYLTAQIKAYKIFITDPERTIAIGRKHLPDVEEAVLRRELYEVGHLDIHPDPESDRIRDFYQALIDIGYCEGPIERIEPYIDISIYKDAIDRVLSQYPNDPFYLEMKKHFEELNDGIQHNETT
jgi:NitT/TauT family transport system substrate-binding protein